jgi:hypothetical protein
MKKVLLSILGVSAIFTALLSTGCGTEPKGTEGKITVSDSVAVGTAKVDTITLNDADLTGDTVSVQVTSTADAVGIYLVLSGTGGVYKGTLIFSTAASTAGSTIMVSQNSIITVKYNDAKPSGTRSQTFRWQAGAMAVAVDNTAYQGVATPMMITVTDPNISSQDVTVNVSSTHFTTPVAVTLTKSATVYGQYAGSVYFTVATTITGSDTVHVMNNDTVTVKYSNTVTPSVIATAKAPWTASQPITVASDKASYSGLTDKITLTVTDANVTTSTVTVKLTSSKDPTGITLTLPFAAGTGSIQVGVSLVQSGTNTIAVQAPSDTLKASYTDAALAAPVTGTMMWQASSVAITTDSTDYHGTAGQMAISLTNDHTTASSLVVNVSSAKAGDTIPVTLTAQAGVFTGSVGFTLAAHTATAVGVKDSDVVSISYVDPVMGETKNVTVNWYSTQTVAAGIFGSDITPGSSVVQGMLVKFFNWGPTPENPTCVEETAENHAGTGTAMKLTAGTIGWAGFGWTQVTDPTSAVVSSIDMSAYAACSLHVWLKGNADGLNMLVENATHAGQTWVAATDYGYVNDEQWHEVVVPLSAWSATCDLSGVSYFLGATFSPYTAGQYIIIDDVYWTLPQ